MCFDCWLADDDDVPRPRNLDQDGVAVLTEGKVCTPWVCAACGQHWLSVRDPGDESQTFVRCAR